MQTLIIEEHLLPLHPLALGRTEAQHSFELRQDATRLLPLPTLAFPFLRWQHVAPRTPAFTVWVWVRHIGLPLLVKGCSVERLTTGKQILEMCAVKARHWRIILPAPLVLGLCPGSRGRKEEDQGSRVKEDHTAPHPQHYLQRGCALILLKQIQNNDFNNLLELGHCVVCFLSYILGEPRTSPMTGNSLE